MLHEFKSELGGNFVYWSNSCGDLHHNGEYDIEKVEDLPKELQRAFNELWCEGIYEVRCYLVEFNGEYGIAFEATYDKCYAKDSGITYEKLVEIARAKAVECSKKFPEYNVVFGEDVEPWSDGSFDSIIAIIMPWNISHEKFNEVGRFFEAMCYEIPNHCLQNLEKEINAATDDEDLFFVRTIEYSDLESVAELDELSGNDVYGMIADYEEEVAEYEYAWGAFLNGELIGYCTLGGADEYDDAKDGDLCLSDVFIKEEYRGNGYGTALVKESLKLYSEPGNVFADLLDSDLMHFYEPLGFVALDEFCETIYLKQI